MSIPVIENDITKKNEKGGKHTHSREEIRLKKTKTHFALFMYIIRELQWCLRVNKDHLFSFKNLSTDRESIYIVIHEKIYMYKLAWNIRGSAGRIFKASCGVRRPV